ncbi:hypothetical protein Fmac_021387 [Flemingia macrophylla]|uniref:Uncharacterized protein n=1 Tax=Flemingia macrophylla TaxID=520843 RepID=A0ABD1LWP7_9FABA
MCVTPLTNGILTAPQYNTSHGSLIIPTNPHKTFQRALSSLAHFLKNFPEDVDGLPFSTILHRASHYVFQLKQAITSSAKKVEVQTDDKTTHKWCASLGEEFESDVLLSHLRTNQKTVDWYQTDEGYMLKAEIPVDSGSLKESQRQNDWRSGHWWEYGYVRRLEIAEDANFKMVEAHIKSSRYLELRIPKCPHGKDVVF